MSGAIASCDNDDDDDDDDDDEQVDVSGMSLTCVSTIRHAFSSELASVFVSPLVQCCSNYTSATLRSTSLRYHLPESRACNLSSAGLGQHCTHQTVA